MPVDQEAIEQYLEHKRRVAALHDAVREALSSEDNRVVGDFLAEGEPRLAAEFLVTYLSEEDVPITASFYQELVQLLIDLGSDSRTGYLKTLIR